MVDPDSHTNRRSFHLREMQPRVEERLHRWRAERFASRLWGKDPTLWSPEPAPELTDRLGWLSLPVTMRRELDALVAFAEAAKAEGLRHAVLLGMGGSSLAPEVFQRTFGNGQAYPELLVLDSTHPEAIRAVETSVDLSHTLFLVSSKSGTTTETLSFFRYFWRRLSQREAAPGSHFVAITDPGTPLERLARERGFRRVFPAPPDVGGRYSALSVFGLVPAALIGVDIHRLLERAGQMAEACSVVAPERENPGLTLGATLGELALAGRDKVTLLASSSLEALPPWLEQLLAESTGKNGKGIVPVVEEPLGSPQLYGTDRLFVCLEMEGDTGTALQSRMAALEAAGHPVVRLSLQEKTDLGEEFFRWEVAVAAAGAVLGIHPFDQPDVQLAKELAQQAMARKTDAAKGLGNAAAEDLGIERGGELERALESWLAKAQPGDYFSLQAYLAPTVETTAALQGIRLVLRDRFRLATTVGYGPRFLHSTGQLHKGGPNTGLFLQLVDEPAADLPVPETSYSFGAFIQAQALGDFQALRQRNRRVLRVRLGGDVARGLKRLTEMLPGR